MTNRRVDTRHTLAMWRAMRKDDQVGVWERSIKRATKTRTLSNLLTFPMFSSSVNAIEQAVHDDWIERLDK